MNKLNTYNILARLKLDVGIDIKAESLSDAIEKAKLLKETDFVKIYDDYNDGSMEIIGVYINRY